MGVARQQQTGFLTPTPLAGSDRYDTCRGSAVMDVMLDVLFADFQGKTGAGLAAVEPRLQPSCR